MTTFSYNTSLEALEEKLQALRKLYPGPLVHKILVFGTPAEDALVGTKHIIPILSSRISTVTRLGTVICDITTDLLSELAVYYLSRQFSAFKSPALKELEQPAQFSAYGGAFQAGSQSELSSGLQSPTGSISSNSGRQSSKSGSLSLSITDRMKAKQKGRMLKFQANLYLLSGHWSNALRDFSEAATALKSAFDHLWFASALEGIGVCLVLLSFLEAPVSIPAVALATSHHAHKESQGEVLTPVNSNSSANGISLPPPIFEFLPELTNTLLRFYARSQATPEERVPQLTYCESLLRLANLLAIARVAGGWTPAALSAIVRGTALITNVTSDSPSVSAISSWCNKVYATDLANIPLVARSKIYCGLAAIYSNIGLVRKRTFLLREMLARLTSPRGNLRLIDEPQLISVLEREADGGVQQLLSGIGDVYGAGSMSSIGCGWEELRVSFFRTALSVCESLKDFAGIVKFAGLLLSTSADVITGNEQVMLSTAISAAIQAAHKQGQTNVLAVYWDPNLLRDVRLIPTNTRIAPQYTKHTGSANAKAFIHNPYAAKRGPDGEELKLENQVMVQNERAEFAVRLQNPYAFELHVKELSLMGQDVELNALAKNFYIAPGSVYDVSFSGVAVSTGQLKITGCRILVSGCEPREFDLGKQGSLQYNKLKKAGVKSAETEEAVPVTKQPVEITVIPAQPVMVLKNISLNHGWLMLLEGEKQEFTFTLTNISDVDANLVQLQFSDATTEPLKLALSNKELPQSEVYEIEYFLHKRKALHWKRDKDSGDNRIARIPAHEAATFTVEVTGKRGMTDGVVQIEYCNRDEPLGGAAGFWSRMMPIDFSVTVNPSVELGGCDIMALPHEQKLAAVMTGVLDVTAATAPETGDGSLKDHCLIVLDLRNAWKKTLEVKLWSCTCRHEHGHSDLPTPTPCVCPNTKFTVVKTIDSGLTQRFVIPIQRIRFTKQELERPIPSLGNRQFIVDSNSTAEQQQTMRENFWYREAVLAMLGGSWREEGVFGGGGGGGDQARARHGALELRGIHVTTAMVQALRIETLELSMHASIDGSPKSAEGSAKVDELTVQAEIDYVTLSTTISNHNISSSSFSSSSSSSSISGFLRFVPSERYGGPAAGTAGDDTSTSLLYNGTLQRPVLDIKPGESKTVSIGFVALCPGEYEWTSVFDEFEASTSTAAALGTALKETAKTKSAPGQGQRSAQAKHEIKRRHQHFQRTPFYIKAE